MQKESFRSLGIQKLPKLSPVRGGKGCLVFHEVVIADLSGPCSWISTLTDTVTLLLKLSNFAETATIEINGEQKWILKTS